MKTPKVRIDGDVYCFDGDVGISARIDGVDTRLDALNSTDGALETKDTELSGRIDTLNTTDDALKTRLDALETTNDALKTKDTELSGRIDTLNTTDDAMKTRLDALETTNDALKTKDTELSGRIDTLNTTDAELKTRLDALETTDDALKTKDTELSGRIDTLLKVFEIVDEFDSECSLRNWTSCMHDGIQQASNYETIRLQRQAKVSAYYIFQLISLGALYKGDGNFPSIRWDSNGVEIDSYQFDCEQTLYCASCNGLGWHLGGRIGYKREYSDWRDNWKQRSGSSGSYRHNVDTAYNMLIKTFTDLPAHTSVDVTTEVVLLNRGGNPLYFSIDGVLQHVLTEDDEAIATMFQPEVWCLGTHCRTPGGGTCYSRKGDKSVKLSFRALHNSINLTLVISGWQGFNVYHVQSEQLWALKSVRLSMGILH